MSNCTADIDSPCDGGGRDADGFAIPCAECAQWQAEIMREALAEFRAGIGRRKEDLDAELREAGRQRWGAAMSTRLYRVTAVVSDQLPAPRLRIHVTARDGGEALERGFELLTAELGWRPRTVVVQREVGS